MRTIEVNRLREKSLGQHEMQTEVEEIVIENGELPTVVSAIGPRRKKGGLSRT